MKKLAIIDDDRDICKLLSRFLKKEGFDTHEYYNGSDALEAVKEEQFDVILCDYKLPDITGIELLRKLKIFNPDAVVIVITGYSDVKIAVDAVKHGAFDYVVKPLYPDEILHTISSGLVAGKKENSRRRKKSAPTFSYVQGTSPHCSIFGASVSSMLSSMDQYSVTCTGHQSSLECIMFWGPV